MRKPYTYFVTNLTGCAIGISDFGFSVTVCANSREDAEGWGHHVASIYSEKFGLPPHGIKLEPDHIRDIGLIMKLHDCDYDAPGDIDADSIREPDTIVCDFGHLPPELTD